jgi:hypothetical protein
LIGSSSEINRMNIDEVCRKVRKGTNLFGSIEYDPAARASTFVVVRHLSEPNEGDDHRPSGCLFRRGVIALLDLGVRARNEGMDLGLRGSDAARKTKGCDKRRDGQPIRLEAHQDRKREGGARGGKRESELTKLRELPSLRPP